MINPQLLLLVHIINMRCHVTALGCLKPPFVKQETVQVDTLHFESIRMYLITFVIIIKINK